MFSWGNKMGILARNRFKATDTLLTMVYLLKVHVKIDKIIKDD